MSDGDDLTDQSQKTEDPTAKRLMDARKKGDVAQSREINHWIMIATGTYIVLVMGPDMMSEIKDILRPFLGQAAALADSPYGLDYLIVSLVIEIAKLLFLPLLLLVIAALTGPLLQVGPLFTTETMKPKLSKISLLSGVKRLFSMKSIVEFLKGVGKMIIIAGVIVLLMLPFYTSIEHFVGLPILTSLEEMHTLVFRVMIGVLSILTIIAVLDYTFQKMEHIKKLRMSKQEIKDEFKQTEGDPHVKARLAELRQTRARQRMMAAVPEADVVITNPTHYAIALKYDPQQMDAPIMIAKGVDKVAERIKDVAKEHDITIVENPPLARGLYEGMELNQIIPADFYKAVAEVISYVFKVKKRKML